jgi:hypothetical protein
MAIAYVRTSSIFALFCSTDPAVVIRADVVAALWTDDVVAALPIAQRAPRFVTREQCESVGGDASKFIVRPLSWLEDQAIRNLPPEQFVAEYVRLGLQSIDDDDDEAQRFKLEPAPELVTPLWRRIHDATWGNL